MTEIILERQNEVVWITLNRPAKMNALTAVMLKEWREVLANLEKDESCRIIVVSGAGRAWSAGVDLEIFQHIKIEPGFTAYDDGVEIMRLLENMPQVTIAMVNGYCFTGALEILMAFDLIYAAAETKIGDTHTKWGIPPKWGMTQRLLRQVGMRKAKELSFTAKAISGTEAERIGLVNKAVPLDVLKENVEAVIQQILQNSQQTITAFKKMYQFGNNNLLEDGLEYERNFQLIPTDKTDDLKNFKSKI